MRILENIEVSLKNARLLACANRHYQINNIEYYLKQSQIFGALFFAG